MFLGFWQEWNAPTWITLTEAGILTVFAVDLANASFMPGLPLSSPAPFSAETGLVFSAGWAYAAAMAGCMSANNAAIPKKTASSTCAGFFHF